MTITLPELDAGAQADFFYGALHALKSITAPLYANKVTAFIGPSGCGKSTLLRVFNRMYDLYPDHRADGEVLLDGKNILDPDVDVSRFMATMRTEASFSSSRPMIFTRPPI